ncbi:MAG: hypothetical protein ACM3PY_19700 [Omnitrophica WOR_2 bacterium]
MPQRIFIYCTVAVPVLVGLAACTSIFRTVGPTPTPTTAFGTYAAQVDRVTVEVNPSPLQANAIVHGELTEACARLGEIRQSYQRRQFLIQVSATSPIDRGCIQITTPFEEKVPLDIASLPAGRYTVVVNGVVSDTFTLETASSTPSKEP